MSTTLGIDPGGTTGIALVHTFDDVAVVTGAWQIDCSTDQGLVDCGMHVERLIGEGLVENIAIERFTISGRTVKLSRQYEALYMIGIVKYLVGQSDVNFKMQSPADAKAIWGDWRIKENLEFDTLRFDVPVKKPHSYDALRHALLYSKFVGVVPDGTEDFDVVQ